MERQNIFTSCGGCMENEGLIEATAELHKIYQFLVKEQVSKLKLCFCCTVKLEDFHNFGIKCRESLDVLTKKTKNDLKCEEIYIKVEPKVELGLSTDDDENEKVEEEEKEKNVLEDVPQEIIDTDVTNTDDPKSKNGRYNCEKCTNSYKRKSSLKRHLNDAHSSKSYECTQCNSQYPSLRYLEHHVSVQHSKNFCKYCSLSMKHLSREEFAKHMAAGHKFKCFVCNFTSMSKNSVRLHLKKIHKTSDKNLVNIKQLEGDENDEENKNENSEEFFRSDYDPSKRTPKGKVQQGPISCEHCGVVLKKASQYQNHILKVHSEKNLQCPSCPKKFTCSQYLKRHISSKHDGKYCYYCATNLKGLSKEEFDAHVASVHSFSCHFCGFVSKYKTSISIHIQNHHLPKPLEPDPCEFCGDKFANANRLKLHIIKRHKEATLECQQCPKKFPTAPLLKRHVFLSHTTRTCEFCGRKVAAAKLSGHVSRVHQKVKNYQCSICNMQFHDIVKMRRHLFTHGNAKPFICHICKIGFSDHRSIVKHYGTSHDIHEASKDIMKMIERGVADHGKEFIIRIGPNKNFNRQ